MQVGGWCSAVPKSSDRTATAGIICEYFCGDNRAGIGASHQTEWTGLVAGLIEIFC